MPGRVFTNPKPQRRYDSKQTAVRIRTFQYPPLNIPPPPTCIDISHPPACTNIIEHRVYWAPHASYGGTETSRLYAALFLQYVLYVRYVANTLHIPWPANIIIACIILNIMKVLPFHSSIVPVARPISGPGPTALQQQRRRRRSGEEQMPRPGEAEVRSEHARSRARKSTQISIWLELGQNQKPDVLKKKVKKRKNRKNKKQKTKKQKNKKPKNRKKEKKEKTSARDLAMCDLRPSFRYADRTHSRRGAWVYMRASGFDGIRRSSWGGSRGIT